MQIRRPTIFLALLLAIVAFGCKSEAPESASGKPVVVCTTTMLEDMTREIAGDAADVRGIMKPGGDPHLYQPSPADAKMISQSKLVITSGLHLEGWIDDLVRNAGGERPVAVASEGVEPIKMKGAPGGVDPHFWFDLQAWSKATTNVQDAVIAVTPEADHEGIRTRTKAYQDKLTGLHAWTEARLESIPAEGRVLITSHDAFNYFGRRYKMDVVGIQGTSTESEASQRDVARVVELVKERSAKAVFVESSVNPALIKQVARETGVTVAGPLYSDSVGPAGSGAESYEGMVKANVKQITEALGGTYVEFAGITQ